MSEPGQVMIKDANEGRTVGLVGDIYRFLVTSEETGGRYSMFEAIVLPGGGSTAYTPQGRRDILHS